MAVVLALVSALAYGLSDFVGGVVSRRVSAWSVAVVGQLSSTVCTALVALTVPGSPHGPDLAWRRWRAWEAAWAPPSCTGASPAAG